MSPDPMLAALWVIGFVFSAGKLWDSLKSWRRDNS